MKTAELDGAELDYWVAKAEGYELDADGDNRTIRENGGAPSAWNPSTDWRQGGPIIEREHIATMFNANQENFPGWSAFIGPVKPMDLDPDWMWGTCGPTPLIAGMRCYVDSVFGPDVDATA